jgi:hypothetical protein
MSDQPKNLNDEPRFIFSRLATILLAGMWLLSGSLKFMDPAGFQSTLELHRVLSDNYRAFGLCIAPTEIQLGLFMIFVGGSELRKTFGRVVLLSSMSLMIVFTVYLNLVDPEILQESGCGCLSDHRVASGIGASEYAFSMIRNSLLIGLHLVALLGPWWTLRKRDQRGAKASA